MKRKVGNARHKAGPVAEEVLRQRVNSEAVYPKRINGEGDGVLSSGCVNVLMPISGDSRPDKPEEPQKSSRSVPKNNEEENAQDLLCTKLLETRMACDERDNMQMLQSHQLVKACDCIVRVITDARGVWTTSMNIVDTGAGPNFIR